MVPRKKSRLEVTPIPEFEVLGTAGIGLSAVQLEPSKIAYFTPQ
jgi:hypothetical protein